ncbi:TBC1 domain family member 7-like [Mytilus galloprovincialis]|uniref:TBC1 domain family member 7-like n=1 Tax=Mytilus galloprovincialis TaxID=29158 RepID=UPI003F7BBFCD
MSDERNFRTYYYKKFGIGGVEEKKSIEILLNEHPLNVDKLRQFCLMFQVPAKYRIYLWKVILGILPCGQGSHEFVMDQRKQQYNDLLHALKLMRRVDNSTTAGLLVLKMYKLETGMLTFEEQELVDPDDMALFTISEALSNIEEDDINVYWIAKKFYEYFLKWKEPILSLTEKAVNSLKKEDPKIWQHLNQHDMFSILPLRAWFLSGFADILPNTSMERIWDKVVGGSFAVLVHVAVAIFLTFKRPLLSMNNRESMLKYLSKLPEDSGDVVVVKALDLWQQHGGHQMVARSDSPLFSDRSPS